MIKDARVLDPEFLPPDVVHRAAHISHLSDAIRPITEGEPAQTSFLYGPSGSGKTCIAKFVVNQLREEVLDVNSKYVNCWQDYSRYKTLYRVLEGLNRTIDIHRQSTPTDELIERLRAYDGEPYIVILDEVDQLEDKSVLYDLYQIRSISMVLIANSDDEFFNQLGRRLTSRLQTSARIHFDSYSLAQLVSILKDRVEWGLHDGVIESDQLELIANAAAGDARVAIGILQAAARRAKANEHSSISDDIIEASVSEAKSEITQKNIQKLTPDQRVLYDIIVDAGEIAPSDLYEQYNEQAEDPKSDRTVRTNLQKMVHYNLIAADGENRGRTYRAL